MKNIFKKVASLILIFAVTIVSIMPIDILASDFVNSSDSFAITEDTKSEAVIEAEKAENNDDTNGASAEFTYQIENNSVTITGYNGEETAIVIPAVIDGYEVTAIGENAFQDDSELNCVEIPESVIVIGAYAFNNCIGLTGTLEIPESVKSIGEAAFGYCSSLEEIEIPDSVENIEDSVFMHCRSLTSVALPEGITSIGYYIFSSF